MLNENDPDFGSIATELYRGARVHMSEKRWTDAAQCLERSIEVDPHHKTLELLGECRIEMQQYLRAVVPLAAATTLNRGVRAPSLLSQTLLLAGRLADAETAAKLALERDPNNRLAKNVIEMISSSK
jgi:tetratricopeptide (TPR) repeat protein